jgi:hypothetical protein
MQVLFGKSPVAQFRELLAMTTEERKVFLTNRPPGIQKLILAKLREYEALKPTSRELRLQVTELRWYLLPLMSVAPTNRAVQLAAIPEEPRKMVEQRLREWDLLPAKVQQELLENEAIIRHFIEVESTAGQEPAQAVDKISQARRELLERGLRQIREMSEDERQRLLARFNQFFDLRPQEKEKALSTLSEPERRQMEKTLHSFGSLSPVKRAQCIRSFEKFANLSLEERQQFLKNADRWKLMTPEQRQAWRDLVEKVPMTPFGLGATPRPPKPTIIRRSPMVATNGN